MPEGKLELEWRDGSAGQRILICKGPLTIATLFGLRDAATQAQGKWLILDMSQVPYVDSAGLGTLVQINVSCQRHGGRLALAGPTSKTTALLQMTNLSKVFQVYSSVAEAEQAPA
ncbi:MAG TPA: STAS domain-containing protein [Methylomirabilota bacterium]|jgi:anti-sigma B factor antagonist|nr:STAS domain-containing protein [Methylomirabilota bacterium]